MKKIKVGYSDVKIQYVGKKEDSKWCKDHHGEFVPETSVIKLAKEQRPSEELNTLIHEILHAITYIYGLNNDAGPLKKSQVEEQVVAVMANGIQQIIRDNPSFLAYVNKQIGADKIANQTREKTVLRLKKVARKTQKKSTFSANRKPRRPRRS
jgi:hypothetical protein